MAKIKALQEVTVYDVSRPLDWVPKNDWPELIHRKSSYASSALNEDLDTAVKIIAEFEKHQAWAALNMSRQDFYRHKLHLQADKVLSLLKGYRILLDRGQNPTHWQQAVNAVKPLGKIGGRKATSTGTMHGALPKPKKPGPHTHAYLIGRLKRDHPDIALRLANGEFHSVRAAAKAAGITFATSRDLPLPHLRHYWSKATNPERQTFLAEIGAKLLPSPQTSNMP